MISTRSESAASGSQPLLSVGVPVFNGLPYLEESLESLMEQEMEDLEIIVCDNASTDGTREFVERVADTDERIRYYRNSSNIGGTRNFNRTFRLARGKYFRWASSDDFVGPNSLRRCVRVLERDSSAILAFPETVLVDDEGEAIGEYDDGSGWEAEKAHRRFEYSLTRWGLANVHYGMIRSEVLAGTSLLGHYPGSDLVLLAELTTRGPFRRVTGAKLYRRVHPESTASREPDSLAHFFDPERPSSFGDQFLRMFRSLASVVWSAPVDLQQKARMYGALLRHGVWARRRLASELTDKVLARPVKRLLNSVTRTSGDLV